VAVFLDVPFDLLVERLSGKSADRPLFRSPEEARQLFEARLPFYRMADWTIPLNREMTVADVVGLLASTLRGRNAPPVESR
jgi:shikimate kinase